MDYAPIRDDDVPVEWAEGLPEEIWEKLYSLNIKEKYLKIFEERFCNGFTLEKIAKKRGISFQRVHFILSGITSKLLKSVEEISPL